MDDFGKLTDRYVLIKILIHILYRRTNHLAHAHRVFGNAKNIAAYFQKPEKTKHLAFHQHIKLRRISLCA